MRHEAVSVVAIVWPAGLLLVVVASIARSRTTAERIVALDLATLVLIGLLAASDRRPYALDAASARWWSRPRSAAGRRSSPGSCWWSPR